MARDSKIEVAAVNLRIPAPGQRDYVALLKQIYEGKIKVRVYGDSHLVITYFNEKTGYGVFSKYTEIANNQPWFNIEHFDAASPEDMGKINIPAELKPNFAQFAFLLDSSIHTVAFEAYSESKALSLNEIKKYFSSALDNELIIQRFGHVECSIISSFKEAQNLLQLPDLKEVRITIRRPNSDDVGENLGKEIEDRLTNQHGSEYEEIIRAKGVESLQPDARTKKLATVAAENGEVEVQSVENGVKIRSKSSSTPLKEVEKFQDDGSASKRFFALAKRIFIKVRNARSEARA